MELGLADGRMELGLADGRMDGAAVGGLQPLRLKVTLSSKKEKSDVGEGVVSSNRTVILELALTLIEYRVNLLVKVIVCKETLLIRTVTEVDGTPSNL